MIGAAGDTFAGEEEERRNEPVPAKGSKEVRDGLGPHYVGRGPSVDINVNHLLLHEDGLPSALPLHVC